MDTIFINSENTKTSKPHILILKLTNKLDLRIGEGIIALSNLITKYLLHMERHKSTYNNSKFRKSAPTWNDILSHLVDRIRYQIFKIIFNAF